LQHLPRFFTLAACCA